MILFGQRKKKEINWFPSYYYKHKIPFGTRVFYDQAKENLSAPVEETVLTPYLIFNKSSIQNNTYLVYNNQLTLGETNLKTLLEWVKKGNNFFIFTQKIDPLLLDSLHINLYSFYDLKQDSTLDINFTNPLFKLDKSMRFDRPVLAQRIISLDSVPNSISYEVLGTINDSLANFVRFNYGKGKIYFHSMPLVLTNYFMLQDDNYKYNEGLLSYLNNSGKVYWDTHYQNGAGSGGFFRVLQNNPAFLWAYRLLFYGVLLFLLFEAKRKQRPIPIVQPPVNESLNFTKTLASLYINNKDHKEMASIQIKLFMEWLKNSLYLDISKPVNELIKDIEKLTDLPESDIKQIFKKIDELENKEKVNSSDLIELEKLINNLKNGI